jgi:hypothetical protein
MSLAHFNAFLLDVQTLKSGSRFYHPTVNLDPNSYWQTSLMGLIQHLQANINGGPMTLNAAMQHLQNRNDARLPKYMPAIERLVQVWGTANPYPAIPGVRNERREKALFNFANILQHVPAPLRPTWQALEQHNANAFGFGAALGPGYIHRVVLGLGNNLDITARSLLLNAGLAPPCPGIVDSHYIAKLRLTRGDLRAMSGRSILDVGCGGAIFRSEMAALYGCATDGIDLHSAHVGGAVNEGKRRYVASMLYLKMLKDLGTLQVHAPIPAWSESLIERIVANFPAILNHYQANLPHQGDLLNNFTATAQAIRAAGWDYSVTMFVLCYFNGAQQTTAVDGMCDVTNRVVHLHSGTVHGLAQPLIYNAGTITANHAGAQIQIIDTETHRIRM